VGFGWQGSVTSTRQNQPNQLGNALDIICRPMYSSVGSRVRHSGWAAGNDRYQLREREIYVA